MAGNRMAAALIGWKRSLSDHGIILSLQLASSREDAQNREFDSVSLALNDRQLRSLARDLQRAADERGLKLWANRRRFGFLPRLWHRSDARDEAL